MTLLSGGERALTAIALLFAMLMLKTARVLHARRNRVRAGRGERQPLCGLRQAYSDGTQFILITHRKGSMEVCDNALRRFHGGKGREQGRFRRFGESGDSRTLCRLMRISINAFFKSHF
jgi:hypothetical protein